MKPNRLVLRLAVATLVAASRGGAQIIRVPHTVTPAAFASLSLGWLQQGGLCDEPSNACWNFDGAAQWRATLELPIGSGAALGVAGTTSRVGLEYSGTLTDTRASANVSQVMATFRIGGSETGLHQVIDGSAGVTMFSNFRGAGGARLGPGGTTSDFAFTLGYGFGYGFSRRMEAMIVQDYGLVIHRHAMSGSDNSMQQATTRIGFRLGLGDRTRY